MSANDLEIRRATPDDLPQILRLLEETMGWDPAEPNEAFFRWKHLENPFGPSPAWVAVDGDRLAGFRTFLQWRFRRGDEVIRAVRAVDTATHPDYQGRGIFTRLTLQALEDLRQDGIGFVFNTPNANSLPGYLKMGWVEVGRLPVRVRIGSLTAPWRIIRSRVPADKWSIPSAAGMPALEALADAGAIEQLLQSQPTSERITTDRSVAYLRWRYGFGPLHYRAVVAPAGPGDGVAVFRVRRRGPSTEAAMDEVLAPGVDPRSSASLAKATAEVAMTDYAIGLGSGRWSARWLPLPGGGPVLTARPVTGNSIPALEGWALSLGDVELL